LLARILIGLLSVMGFSSLPLADTWASPEPFRDLESANGRYLLRVVSGGMAREERACEAIIFEHGPNARDDEVA